MADHAASMHHPQSDNLGKLANLHKCKSPSSPCDNTPISPWGISLHPASHHRKLLDTVTNSYKPCLTASNVKGLLKTSVALVSNKAFGGFWGITESSFKSLRLEVGTAKMQSLSLQRTRDCRLPWQSCHGKPKGFFPKGFLFRKPRNWHRRSQKRLHSRKVNRNSRKNPRLGRMLCKHTELFTHFCPKPESSSIPSGEDSEGQVSGTPGGDLETSRLQIWHLGDFHLTSPFQVFFEIYGTSLWPS